MLCSNPDCGALTSGPASENDDSVNIGEAAHIYGRTTVSARFKPGLTDAEVCDITNGLWLCRNCHKLIDNDAQRFPADLLFVWRRQHEAAILARLGRPGDQLREAISKERLRKFDGISYLAQQIILDRPRLWEYKLATEIFRSEFVPVHTRWQQLQRGLYVRKAVIVPLSEVSDWLSAKLKDASGAIAAVSPLLKELMDAFGLPGTSGDDEAIVNMSRLIIAAARNMLEWEEDMRFTHVPTEFHDALAALQGFTGRQIEELLRIPNELAGIVAEENPFGTRTISLVFSIPEEATKAFSLAMDRAADRILRRG